MKVRVGVGLGTRVSLDAAGFGTLVDACEDLGFDSLWLSERLTGTAPDPLVGLAVAAGRTERLKLGTSVSVLPGRNPVEVAKAWASLDCLSGGRALPAFGLGVADPAEQAAFGVAREDRAGWFDEALPLVRRLWSGEAVDHRGARFRLEGIRIRPTPVQDPLEVWMGGQAPSELRRVGRLGDGWLPSFCTPEDVARGRPVVEAAAGDADRSIDPEHWGALVFYRPPGSSLPGWLAEAIRRRRPGIDPEALVPDRDAGVRSLIERFVSVGASKFVAVPVTETGDWGAELGALARSVLDLQSR